MTVELVGGAPEATAGVAAPRRDPLARFTVAGLGTVLPERRVTNADLERYLDTSDEWITSRSGITERRIAGEGETTGTLSIAAARRALDTAGVSPADVDVVLVATATPERPMPSTASSVAAALGISAGAFDLNAACAGFVYGLATACSLLGSGLARTVLLVGTDTMSRYVDQRDRSTAVLFGDGAGAVVLRGDETAGEPGGLLACDLVNDPDASELLVVPAGGSAEPATAETVAAGRHFLRMDGSEVFRRAVRGVADSLNRTLADAGCRADQIDLFVPHQANARIIEAVLPRVGLTVEQTIQTVDHHGNTSAASIPLALGEAVAAGRVSDGDLILTSGFGAGLTIGTALLRWRAG